MELKINIIKMRDRKKKLDELYGTLYNDYNTTLKRLNLNGFDVRKDVFISNFQPKKS